MVLRGRRAYAATNQKGLQVIDLDIARDVFSQQTGDDLSSPGFWQMQGRLNLPGQGFGQEAIVARISVPHADGVTNKFTDLAVGDYLVEGSQTRLLVATGASSLVIADGNTGQLLHNGPIPWPDHDPISGWTQRVALGRVGTKDVAAVLLWASGGTMLAIVDIANPAQPRVLNTVLLPANAFTGSGNLLLQQGIAYIGGRNQTTLINLSDPAQPRLGGVIEGTGGNLALSDSRLLYGATPVYGSNEPQPGLTIAALEPIVVIKSIDPVVVKVDDAGATTEPIVVKYKMLGVSDELTEERHPCDARRRRRDAVSGSELRGWRLRNDHPGRRGARRAVRGSGDRTREA